MWIDSITLSGVDVFLEQMEKRNNLRDLLNAMPARESPRAKQQTNERNISVFRVTIEDITVHLNITRAGQYKRSTKIEIEPIVLEDIGTDRPVNKGDVAAQILAGISAGVIRQVSTELPAEVVRNILYDSGEAVNLDKGFFQESREVIRDTGKRMYEGIRNIFRSGDNKD